MVTGSRHEEQVQCDECNKYIVASQLENHKVLKHRKERRVKQINYDGPERRKKTLKELGLNEW